MKSEKVIVITIAVIAFAALTVAFVWLSSNLPFGGADYIAEHSPYHPADDESPGILTGGDTPAADENHYVQSDDDSFPPYPYEGVYPGNGRDEEYHPNAALPIFTREPLPVHIIELITGVTFHENTPFDYSFLTYLTVTHVNFDGESVIGHLIVADEIGDEVLEIFMEIYESRFPIYSIRLIDYFDASDYYSMAANNSHAFNFRNIAGTNIISRHGFGMAIDINPIQNPYIRGDVIWPAAGAEYLDRSDIRPGMILPGGAVYNAFISRGWVWGGYWTSPRDYHHFERR